MNILKSFAFLTLAFALGCQPKTTEKVASTTDALPPIREHSVLAVLWQQQAGEYKALCHQAFNLAKMRVDEILAAEQTSNLPLAIVTDIDETVLDNSPYNGMLIREDADYTKETWREWGAKESAAEVPGSLEFFKYAAAQGIEVFYVSNRFDDQTEATLKNLQQFGYPNADKAHIFLKTETSGKEPRRKKIMADHEIILLLGDNLSDFAEIFDKKGTQDRNDLVVKNKAEFGRKFIVLPNVMYGDWETKGFYEGQYDWTDAQRDSIRAALVSGY